MIQYNYSDSGSDTKSRNMAPQASGDRERPDFYAFISMVADRARTVEATGAP